MARTVAAPRGGPKLYRGARGTEAHSASAARVVSSQRSFSRNGHSLHRSTGEHSYLKSFLFPYITSLYEASVKNLSVNSSLHFLIFWMVFFIMKSYWKIYCSINFINTILNLRLSLIFCLLTLILIRKKTLKLILFHVICIKLLKIFFFIFLAMEICLHIYFTNLLLFNVVIKALKCNISLLADQFLKRKVTTTQFPIKTLCFIHRNHSIS